MQALLSLFRYLREFRGRLALSLLLLAVSTAAGLLQPQLTEYVIDQGMGTGNLQAVLIGALGMFGAALVSAALALASGWVLIRCSQGFGYRLRNAVYRQIMAFSFANLDKWRTGELMVRLNSDVNTVRMFVRMGSFMIVFALLTAGGTVVAMLLKDAWLGGIMAWIMPALMVVFILVALNIRPLFMKARQAVDALNNAMQENLAGAKLVRAFARQREEIRKFELRNQANYDVSIEVGVKMSIFFPLFLLIGNLAVLVTLWAGGWAIVEQGSLTLGELVAFNNYATMALFPIMMLGMVLNFISMAIASATRLKEILDEKPTVGERPDALRVAGFRGAVEFRGVSFRYGQAEAALEGIQLAIKPGQTVGIIGATGSGKTSLVNLIPRFYDPAEGQVLIDGHDVKDLALDSLRSRVAMVLQETVLFSGTIRENVAFGAPGASQEELDRVAALACADGFIAEKALGWDEPVGERGAGLSGGQRQRLAIARALASKPDILILDDVTSSLDAATEQKIVAGLAREAAGRTTIIISQKVNTIKDAELIVVMADGRVAASGRHDELLAGSPIYRSMVETQLGPQGGRS